MLHTILIILFYLSESTLSQSNSICTFSNRIRGNRTINSREPNGTKQQCNPDPVLNCTLTRYRSFDGTCNNLQRPAWGAADVAFNRLLDSIYADGISAFPTSITGEDLESARKISVTLFREQKIDDLEDSLYSPMWGQILAHDMSFSAGVSQTNNDPVVCCQNGNLTAQAFLNPTCAPIIVSPDDPFLGPFGIRCLDFQRTDTTINNGCSPPDQPTEQINVVTSFMDASIIYGVSKPQADFLREMSGGRLRVTMRGRQDWPPQAPNVTGTCMVQFANEPCYVAGDPRVNQNTHLTLLQVILLREHNRIAIALELINPTWDDETLYQEARRILIAILQHIHYYEYLPTVLGKNRMVKNKLIYPGAEGYVSDYDPNVDPTILNEFTTTAFRHSHNEIQGLLKILEENRDQIGRIRLSDWFNRPLILEIGDYFNGLSRGITDQKSGRSDQFWDLELTQFLFKGNNSVGEDLAAIDIQRGRDHGLDGYSAFLKYFGLSEVETFSDFLKYISPKNVASLKDLYNCPADVDLRVGGGIERSLLGSKAGPTFTAIMLEQFYRSRAGDKYFYENGFDPLIRFTISQLQSIREGANAARLICDNTDGIERIQRKAFKVISPLNQLVSCDKLPTVDLELWRDELETTV